jgi:hypothetical protein
MARNPNVPFKGRIQKRKTNQLQIITFGLQRAAGPYKRARTSHSGRGAKKGDEFAPFRSSGPYSISGRAQ